MQIATPNEYFFSRSGLKNEPKTKKANSAKEHADIIAPKGRKRQRLQAYKIWV